MRETDKGDTYYSTKILHTNKLKKIKQKKCELRRANVGVSLENISRSKENEICNLR